MGGLNVHSSELEIQGPGFRIEGWLWKIWMVSGLTSASKSKPFGLEFGVWVLRSEVDS